MRRRTISAALLAPFLLLVAAAAAPVVAQAGGGCHDAAVTRPGDDVASVVKIDGCMFSPTIARVPVGTSVLFVNTGDVPHNVTGVIGTWASPELASGAEFRQTLAAPGVYPFPCTLHPGMNGAVVAGGAVAAAAPAAVTTGSEPSAPRSDTATPAATSQPDWMSIGIAALAGIGLGAVGALAAAGMITARRRSAGP